MIIEDKELQLSILVTEWKRLSKQNTELRDALNEANQQIHVLLGEKIKLRAQLLDRKAKQ